MLRVLATIQHSQYADDLKDQQKDLEDWIFEIQAAMYDDHLVRLYLPYPVSFS